MHNPVCKRYLIVFLGFLGLAAIIWFIASCIKGYFSSYEKYLVWGECMAVVFAATALYGKFGWKIQTWGNETEEEKLDQFLFEFFSALSYFGLMLIIFLK